MENFTVLVTQPLCTVRLQGEWQLDASCAAWMSLKLFRTYSDVGCIDLKMRHHAGLPLTDLLDKDVALSEPFNQAVQIKRVGGQLDGEDIALRLRGCDDARQRCNSVGYVVIYGILRGSQLINVD
ncbi:MAG: hypothetical protein EPN41_11785 [Candidimonas sp.]|nr:MAG: hypothetical protein EPN41_11785 [Candidimonas sp.]